ADAEHRVQRVAEVFAWGIRRGVELTGRLFRIHLTGSERDLGHTQLAGSRIHVSALPMLRGEPHGRDVVEGLVLHELGHHLYHRGTRNEAIWQRAHGEGIGHLLNLLADEHLERNLRAIDPGYGDRLKRLDAYAFQHAPQEMAIANLLRCLRGGAARALIATPLEVAYDPASVRLRRGGVLAELDRAGHPVARFARALRMGLGNRSGDPLIERALARCRDLRGLDMPGLYALTRELADLFGGAIELCRVFGGPEGLEFGERDRDVHGAKIDDDVLQREVERILDPRRARSGARSGPPRLQINVSPDEAFDRISTIERVRGDRHAHRELAAEVARHAARLRGHLDDLGLRLEPARARVQGRALDRTRLRALVTRRDPRILVARTIERRTNLFLGVVVDCSSSMSAGDNIARARRFAITIAEAARPLRGVHARFFGFTDSLIYDAGDALDCEVTALHAGGGNNDAAALYHAANVALAAPPRAKLLVMISDGLPTECSVAALRALVVRLGRRHNIVCAQVAVRPLEEVCFPHYIVLDDRELDVAIARFGRMVAELARRSLAS
ncbi:MAG TPA: vWA domain-containing protein, partial [Kofleriaceae bacterium]|nr:vWA domain-containing protein [Kofleriaceae bacterium]